MSLLSRTPKVNPKYHTDMFRRTIEDHLDILRISSTAYSIPSETDIKFRDNYYGLLASLNVPAQYRYVVMRVNKIKNPRLSGEVAVVNIPNYSDVDVLITTLEMSERDIF